MSDWIVESKLDLFTDTTAILISIVSNSYYGMPRGQIHINLPPGHPIMSFETIEIKMAAVSAKRSISFRRICIIIKFSSQRRDSLLFLPTNMAAVTSDTNQEY